MLPDLERLIHLQALETGVERARAAVVAMPGRLAELEERLAARAASLDEAKQRHADGQTARRALEKDLAAAQGRLGRYKDQIMEVKTNKEYAAMQKEIASAEHEVRSLEDRILEGMLAADELAAEVRELEEALAAERREVDHERRAMHEERQALERDMARAADERGGLVRQIDPDALALYEQVARLRRGVAVAEARDGHCSICHVRLRPQVFNEIRRNSAIIQCDSCQRILFFSAVAVQENT